MELQKLHIHSVSLFLLIFFSFLFSFLILLKQAQLTGGPCPYLPVRYYPLYYIPQPYWNFLAVHELHSFINCIQLLWSIKRIWSYENNWGTIKLRRIDCLRKWYLFDNWKFIFKITFEINMESKFSNEKKKINENQNNLLACIFAAEICLSF